VGEPTKTEQITNDKYQKQQNSDSSTKMNEKNEHRSAGQALATYWLGTGGAASSMVKGTPLLTIAKEEWAEYKINVPFEIGNKNILGRGNGIQWWAI